MKTIISELPERYDFLKNAKGAIEIGYPWLSYGAIIALERLVQPTFKVLEFGCGGSTVFWARNCNFVTSFDTSQEWVDKIKKVHPELENISLVCTNENGMLDALRSIPDNAFDILLIDTDPSETDRVKLAYASIPKLKKNGFLVLDNYLDHGLADFDYTGWKILTFDDINYAGRGTRVCVKRF